MKMLKCLSDKEVNELDELLAICKEADQAPVTIQRDKTLNYHGGMNNWFLAYQNELLIGALSVFGPLDNEAEFTGCVHPDFRRQGTFSSLIDAAVTEAEVYGIRRFLFAMDRRSVSGQAMMQKKGCLRAQTEYSMSFPKKHPIPLERPRLHILRTGFEEVPAAAQISAAAFEDSLDATEAMLINGLNSNEREQYAAYFEDRMVAVVSLLIRGGTATINGLAVKPEEQRKGYGADFLAQLLRMLTRRELQVTLEVDSANSAAYTLYKRMGFQEEEVQDYFETWTGSPA